jgi:multifunctional 2-oxoglutarate metabolism enzyme
MAVEAAAIQVTLPAMGESVTEGTILEWHKQVGDTIEADEILVEVSTDKVDAEVPAPASGTIVAIHFAEGDTVQVGSVLAEIAAGAGDGGSSPNTGDGNGSSATAEAPSVETPGEIIDITTPAGGESVTEGTILEWAVKVGDAVEDGDTVVEISTDKVDMELPAPAAGTITELLAEEGATVVVGQVIARMQLGAGAPAGASTKTTPSDGKVAPSPNGAAAATVPSDVKATPVAARVAAAEGVDLAAVTGTGPHGRITKDDVLDFDPATQTGTRTVLKGAAAMLARYMDDSREIPTATSFRTITVTTMDARRKQLKEAGQKVSFTHLIAYAIALGAQQDMPVMSHHFDTIDGKPTRIDDGAVNLGIAVDVEKKDGSRTLMVPVIRDAGRLSFADFKAAFDGLIAKARENKLGADDLVGANVQLTNPGGIGTIASVPRLMKGNGTIVATGSIAYPVGLGNIGDMIGAEKVMTMTSTYDHRVIQGAESGRFLQVVESYLQGEHAFYDGVFASLGAPLGPTPSPPAPAAAAAAARAGAESAARSGDRRAPIIDEELL